MLLPSHFFRHSEIGYLGRILVSKSALFCESVKPADSDRFLLPVACIVYHLKSLSCRARAIFHSILGSLIVSLTLTISFSESFAQSRSLLGVRVGRCSPNAFCVSCRYRGTYTRFRHTIYTYLPLGRANKRYLSLAVRNLRLLSPDLSLPPPIVHHRRVLYYHSVVHAAISRIGRTRC